MGVEVGASTTFRVVVLALAWVVVSAAPGSSNGVKTLDPTQQQPAVRTRVAGAEQSGEKAAYLQLLDQAHQHVCTQDTGLFCALTETLKPTYLSKSSADYAIILSKMQAHFCRSAEARSTDGCKLIGLLAKAAPPAVKVHVQAQLDGSDVVVIDDKIDVGRLGVRDKTVLSDEEEDYVNTVQRVSGNICEANAGSLLCHVSKGLEGHYRQACASGDNAAYLSFLKQTDQYYCGEGSDDEGKAACEMFPLLIKGVPKPHPEDRGTTKILGFLQVLDATVKWYCCNTQGGEPEVHPSLFCHLATGLKQTYLESIKQHNPKSFQDYVSKVESHYCATPEQQAHNRCRIYSLLHKGLPDMVHQDLDVKGLSKLPKLTTEWHSVTDTNSEMGESSGPFPGYATVIPTSGVTVHIDKTKLASKNVAVSINGGPPIPVKTKNPVNPKLEKHIADLERMTCSSSNAVLCEMVKGLSQVYRREAQSAAFFQLLAQLKGHYCKREELKAPCSIISMMLTRYHPTS